MQIESHAQFARAEICELIDRVARELTHLSPVRLAGAIDDIRNAARSNRLYAVADLARGLENALANSSGSVVVLPYLEAMSDAASCDSADPLVAQSFLATLQLRLHG